jgi:hypothetical protein
MEFTPIDFSEFLGREEALKAKQRFKGQEGEPPLFPVMYYRTDLALHYRQVLWIVEAKLPQILSIYPDFRVEFARTQAAVHDDHERIRGDKQRSHKMRQSKKEKAQFRKQEIADIRAASLLAPKNINGFSYEGMMMHALEKCCLEDQYVSWADKVVGFGEACHEIYAGNRCFYRPEEGENPMGEYTKTLQTFGESYPKLAPLFELDDPSLVPPKALDIEDILRNGHPHTRESILLPTGNPHYDFWKRVTIERMGEKGWEFLTTQQEFSQ